MTAKQLFDEHCTSCMTCYEQYKINEMCEEGHKLFDNYYDEAWRDYEQNN
jgi:hypothetical protein